MGWRGAAARGGLRSAADHEPPLVHRRWQAAPRSWRTTRRRPRTVVGLARSDLATSKTTSSRFRSRSYSLFVLSLTRVRDHRFTEPKAACAGTAFSRLQGLLTERPSVARGRARGDRLLQGSRPAARALEQRQRSPGSSPGSSTNPCGSDGVATDESAVLRGHSVMALCLIGTPTGTGFGGGQQAPLCRPGAPSGGIPRSASVSSSLAAAIASRADPSQAIRCMR